MRILVSVDMEGVADITNGKQCRRDSSEFARSCELVTGEANAAIEGALQAGATEVIVNDSHSDMRNIEHDALPPDVRLIRGHNKPLGMVQGAEPGIAGIVYIGYHAAAATIAGILDHSYYGAQVHRMLLNGETCSEARLNSAIVGEMGIPAIFLSGDQSACADATFFMPWITTATVKTALGRTAATSLSPTAARNAIREGVATAVSRLAANQCVPYRPARPITLDLSLRNSEAADVASVIPGVERIDGTTVRYVADSAEIAYRAAETIMRVASTVE